LPVCSCRAGAGVRRNGADQVLDCCFRAYWRRRGHGGANRARLLAAPILAALFSVRDEPVELHPDGFAPPVSPSGRRCCECGQPQSPTGTGSTRRLEARSGRRVHRRHRRGVLRFRNPRRASLLRRTELAVIRTLSSRTRSPAPVGYALGDHALIADLNACATHTRDRCAIAGAMAALRIAPTTVLIVSTVIRERARLSDRLAGLEWRVEPSQAISSSRRQPPGSRGAVATGPGGANPRAPLHGPGPRRFLRITVAIRGRRSRPRRPSPPSTGNPDGT